MGYKLFPTPKQCYDRVSHEQHKWDITRMGESEWFKCPGVPITTSTVSFHVNAVTIGGHVHAHFFASEFGPDTTHGKNGTLVFRLSEWPAFREMMLQNPMIQITEE
jgi:hypothetical protein